MILYFSGTGNSKEVAQHIALNFNDRAVSIEEHNGKIELAKNEMLGFVTPVHWYQLPVLVREFFEKCSIEKSLPNYSFIVTTCGTSPGYTYEEAKKILLKKEMNLSAGFSLKMPDTWTPIFDLSKSDVVAKQNEKAQIYVKEIIEMIRAKKTGNLMRKKIPYFVRLFTEPLYNLERRTKKFYVEESCIGCGLCAKKCPVQAIKIVDNKPLWIKPQCTLCLRCLHHCPKFAIQYGNGATKKHAQYTNPNVRV